MTLVARISKRKVEISFNVQPPGEFAVALHHDENDDHRMQKGLFGQPLEGWGVTHDATGTLSAPSYEDARMEIKPGETKHVTITMRY